MCEDKIAVSFILTDCNKQRVSKKVCVWYPKQMQPKMFGDKLVPYKLTHCNQ